MQHSSTLNHVNLTGVRRTQRGLAGSRSLASMLPSLMATGAITLVITAVVCAVWSGSDNDFFGAWMEAWLTTWPIVFPLFYLSRVLFRKISKDRVIKTKNKKCTTASLSLSQIKYASDAASNKNNLKIRNIRRSSIHS